MMKWFDNSFPMTFWLVKSLTVPILPQRRTAFVLAVGTYINYGLKLLTVVTW